MEKEKKRGGSESWLDVRRRGRGHSDAYCVQHGGWGGLIFEKNVYVINGRPHSVYIAFVQNQHSVYCFCTKSMLVCHALLFYGIFPYHQMATHLSISSIYGSCKDSL